MLQTFSREHVKMLPSSENPKSFNLKLPLPFHFDDVRFFAHANKVLRPLPLLLSLAVLSVGLWQTEAELRGPV